MTPTQFYAALAEKTELKPKDVKAVFDLAQELVLKNLQKDGHSTIGTLGSMKLVNRKARMGRNPSTGEQIKIQAKTIVKVVASGAITDAFKKKKSK